MTNKLDDQWQAIQQKVFTKWCNMHLGKKGLKIDDIQKDFGDGIKLIRLLEVISAEELPKFNTNPKMKIHKIQNVNAALDFVAKKGVKLIGISSENVVDENLKLILGMIWTIILRFAIADISEEELNAKEALLLWCKKKTAGYEGVKVDNFHTSWSDALALCALIHAHRPDLIDFKSLNKSDAKGNAQLAFDVAERELGITKLLDVEDLVDVPKPDERSVMTYIAEFYHVFSADRKFEIAGRRIGKLVDHAKTMDELKNDYENKASEHSKWVKDTTTKLEDRNFGNSLDEIKKLLADLNTFKSEEKPPKVADRLGLETLHNTIQVKLSSAGRPAYVPPEGLSVKDIGNQWDELEKQQQLREEALMAELARQQMLDLLARRFNNKANQLEEWIKTQQEELNKEESIDNLEAAEQKLKAIEAFRQEYEQNKARLTDLHGIKDEYCSHNGKDKEPITERANKIQTDFDGLQELVNKKAASLGDSFAKQQAMEELRKKFAAAAKEYNYWVKDTVSDVSNTVFPDSLEGVENHKSVMDQSDSTITSNNNQKKAHLDDLWEQEKAMGITSNPYTVFNNEDIATWHQQVNDSLVSRQKAYEAELERQKLNEEKRKQFASEAQNFIDHLSERTKSIDSLEGEPKDLIQSVRSAYADGAPEKEKLAGLAGLQEEMASMGIMDNRHTPYTLPLLNINNDTLARHIRNKISALEEEDSLKEEYNTKATALVSWIKETQPTIQSPFDNTLEGVRSIKNKWNVYKTTQRAQRGLDRINLESLFKTIQDKQAANKRPAFVPAEPIKQETINQQWSEMNEVEKQWESAIASELSRQEKIFMQVKHFNSEAEELESAAASHEAYLAKEESITTLDESRMLLLTHDVFDEDVEQSFQKLGDIKSRSDKIRALNYIKQQEVDDKFAGLESRLQSVKASSSGKKEKLSSENATQQHKEGLRLDFAQKAKDYDLFVRNTKASLEDSHFGTTLEAVKDFSSKLDECDKATLEKSNSMKSSAIAAFEELSKNGITDNKHTSKTVDDINAASSEVQSALDARRSAYNAELQKQESHEQERKDWAEKAQSYVDFLEGELNKIKSVQGTPEEKTAAAKAIFQEGKDASDKLEALNQQNTEMRGKGIYSNSHTPYTMLGLQKRNQQFVGSVNNQLSFFDEEQQFLQREKENEKEWQQKQEVEQSRLDFEFKCKKLILFLDSIHDSLTDPINVSSVEAVEELQKDYSSTNQELESQKSAYDEIIAEHSSLTQKGVNVLIDATTSKWESSLANSASRKEQLAEALEKQQNNDALCKAYAEKANEADKWIIQTLAALASTSGDLQNQLVSVQKLDTSFGDSFVSDLSQLDDQLAAGDVKTNKYTELNTPSIRVRVSELASGKKAKESLLQKEIIAKSDSTASPEQIQEFKEVFAHFDKSKNNSLSKSEFKSCLQSLGEDPNDDKMKELMAKLADVKITKETGETEMGIGFEKFLAYMIEITSDTTTETEITSAFKDLAQDKDFITADDLRRSGMATDKVSYLLSQMPAFPGVEGGYDYKKWASSAFNG